MSKDAEYDFWITSSKFFPMIKHEQKNAEILFTTFYDQYIPQEWEMADWKRSESLKEDNRNWYVQQLLPSEGTVYFVAHPATWMQMYKLYKDIPLDQLVFGGILKFWNFSDNPQAPKIKEKLERILLSTLPTPECIREQLRYIYGDPIRFLLLVNYGHSYEEMLKQGRNIRSNPQKIMNDRYFLNGLSRYSAEKRIPKEIIDEYLDTPHLQRYLLLNRTILRAPYCKTPLILFRGGRSDRKLSRKKGGYRFITNGILSTSLRVDFAKTFIPVNCCLFVYHITNKVPRLFTNASEAEVLLPAGLEMEYVGKKRINDYLCLRIKVLRVIGETIELRNRGKDEDEEEDEEEEEDEYEKYEEDEGIKKEKIYSKVIEKIRELAQPNDERFRFQYYQGDYLGIKIGDRVFQGNIWKAILDFNDFLKSAPDKDDVSFLEKQLDLAYNATGKSNNAMDYIYAIPDILYEGDPVWIEEI